MTKRLPLLILAGLLLGAPATAQEQAPSDPLHERTLVLDSHADVLLPTTPRQYYLPDGGSRIDLPRLTAGQVDAIVLSVAVGPGARDAAGVAAARRETDEKLARIRAFVESNAGQFGLALSADDVERLVAGGRIAVLVGFQNARSIGGDLAEIDRLYRDGVRIFAFNHAGHNEFSDSSRPSNEPVEEHGGLSAVGRQAVGKLNDLGVLIDVSQLSTAALLQTLELSRAPVAATHSGVRALVDATRNLADAELDAIKANDGVVQITPFSAYLRPQSASGLENVAALREQYGLPREGGLYDGIDALEGERLVAYLEQVAVARERATLADFVDQIDYVAERIGWRHVGIGSDFDHGSGIEGFDSAADAPNVTRELLRRGYTEDQIAGIWGGNFLRVLRAAEAARAR